MRSPTLLLLAIIAFSSCKNNDMKDSSPDCLTKMKERFKTELKCTEKGVMENNLYVGTYENKKIYFTNIMCPACGTIPPQFGYTCEGTKVDIINFSTKVTDIKELYNSCSL